MVRASALVLLVSVGIATAQITVFPTSVPLVENHGFCAICVYGQPTWPEGKPKDLRVWGSYGGPADHLPARAVTGPFPAPSHLRLYLSGIPTIQGINIEIEKLSDHSKLLLRPIAPPGQAWLPFDFSLPRSWRGASVRVIAEDQNFGPFAWVGMSEPLQISSTIFGFSDAIHLLLVTALDFVLLVLPSFAFCALAVYRGVRDVMVSGLVFLAGTGLPGYIVFWLGFFSPRTGKLVSTLLPIAALVCLIVLLRKLDQSGRRVVKVLVTPVLLTGAASLLVLSTGFLYSGMREPLRLAAQRFSEELPVDNELPFIFAEALHAGYVPKPMLGDWLSSDRPPLQAGIVLSQYPYNPKPRAIGYTALSGILQSLWIFGIWLLLSALCVQRLAMVLAISVSLFSGFVFLNTLYVWPKLLAASYMLGLIAIFFTDRLRARLQHDGFLSVIAGSLLAFALLAHGGSAFALIGAVITMILFRKPVPIRKVAILSASAFVLYLPWILYQKVYDPPGNRLLKWHLAGVMSVDSRPFLETLWQEYGTLGLREILYRKLAHVIELTSHEAEYWEVATDLVPLVKGQGSEGGAQIGEIAFRLRHLAFFNLGPNFGFLMLGPVALAIGMTGRYSRSPEWKAGVVLWMLVAVTAAAWCILMFRDILVVHEGTYNVVLLGYSASVLAFWAISRWLAFGIGTLQIALNCLLYVALMRQPAQNGLLLEGMLRDGMLALTLLSLLCVVLLLRRLARITF